MFQRGIRAMVVCVVFMTAHAFGQPSLPLPAEIVGAPGQRVEAVADLRLGASGMYFFTFDPPKWVQQLLIGSVLGAPTNMQASTPFFYNSGGPAPQFWISGIPPVGSCSQETIRISFFQVGAGKVLDRSVTFRCFPAKAVLSFPKALKGSGTAQDPARYCGAVQPVRISGGGSLTASTYEIEVRDLKDNVTTRRALTASEAASIGDFDLQRLVPRQFFKGGRSYSVTLATLPARAQTAATIAFNAATPRFRMTHRNGKVFDGGVDVNEPVVMCPGQVIMNAAATTCESSYFITVEESDANWTALGTAGWSRWVTGQEAGDGIDLNALIAANPAALDPPNKPFELVSKPVDGLRHAPRYFRVGFATGEPAWDVRWLFVRIGTPDECQRRLVIDGLSNLCPRAGVAWGPPLVAELKRLLVAPCQGSAQPCFNETSKRTYWPGMSGPKKMVQLAFSSPYASGDIEQQNKIAAAMKKMAADNAPMCPTTNEKQVAVDYEITLEPISTGHAVFIGISYACCGSVF